MYGFLQDSQGNRSSKRLGGLTLLTVGILGKIILNIKAATLQSLELFPFYDKIDSSFDVMIYAGTGLLAGSMIEKFSKL